MELAIIIILTIAAITVSILFINSCKENKRLKQYIIELNGDIADKEFKAREYYERNVFLRKNCSED